MDWKVRCEEATKIIESCFDENNPDDGLTFDERLDLKVKNASEEIKEIINIARGD